MQAPAAPQHPSTPQGAVIAKAQAVSALVDGHTHSGDAAFGLQDLVADAQAAQQWHLYQLVGDVLRDRTLAPRPGEWDFADKIQAAIAREGRPAAWDAQDAASTVPMPTPQKAPPAYNPALLQPAPFAAAPRHQHSANAAVWRWKLAAAVATLALGAVLVLGMPAGTEQTTRKFAGAVPASPPVSAAPMAETADASAVVLRDPALDALLAAHQQLGGHSALQMPSGFLRDATWVRSAP